MRRRRFSISLLVKWLGISLLLFGYLVVSIVILILPLSGKTRRASRTRITSFFSRLVLSVFRVRVRVTHGQHLVGRHPGRLLVANHVSYLDVLVLSSLLPSVFITSVELGDTVLLGPLARFGGSLFVERRKRSGLKREIEDIARALEEGFNVVLFPEGTTSNGERVLTFKKSLFASAVQVQADIIPVCLRYTKVDGQPISPHNRNSVFYYGGVAFGAHFPRFLELKSVEVEVSPLRTIKPHMNTRGELATAAHEAINSAYLSQP
jgi:1-acyl-sn-glycerol-3-phosphate acyltransferase